MKYVGSMAKVFSGLSCLGLSLFAAPSQATSLREAYKAFEAQRYPQAAEDFQAHAAQHPEDWEQLYNAGVSLFQSGKLAEAQTFFDRARQSQDRSLKARAAYNSAMVDIMQKRLDKAAQSLQEALSFDNDSVPIRENLDWVKQQLAQNPPDQKNKDSQPPPNSEQKQADQNKDGSSPPQDQAGKDGQQANQDQQQAGKDGKQAGKEGQQANQDQQQAGKDGQQANQDQQQASNGQQASKDAQQGSGAQQAENKDQTKQGKEAGGSADSQQAQNQKLTPGQKPTPGTATAENGDKQKQDDKALAAAIGKGKSQEEGQAPGPNGGSAPAKLHVLSETDLKRQDADKLLRSIEDKIGRYPLDADRQGDAHGKDW